MKAYRLLSILTTLLNHELVSAKDLAQKNEVSIKTIQRDIQTLNMAGVPVFSEQGMKGGYGILDTYKFDTKLLSNFELGALKSILESLRNVYDNKHLENLWEKLAYSLNKDLSDDRDLIHIDLSPWNQDNSVALKVKMILKAIEDHFVLKINYYNMEGIASKRQIEAYSLKMKSGRWYLNAFCLKRKEFRLFKVNRILDLERIEKYFIPRTNGVFDDQKLVNNNGEKKVFRFTGSAYARVIDFFSEEEIKRVDEDCISVTTYLRDDPWLLSMILSFGDQVEVIEPESLIKDVKNIIRKMNTLYK